MCRERVSMSFNHQNKQRYSLTEGGYFTLSAKAREAKLFQKPQGL